MWLIRRIATLLQERRIYLAVIGDVPSKPRERGVSAWLFQKRFENVAQVCFDLSLTL